MPEDAFQRANKERALSPGPRAETSLNVSEISLIIVVVVEIPYGYEYL
jgi:hypothetical protein